MQATKTAQARRRRIEEEPNLEPRDPTRADPSDGSGHEISSRLAKGARFLAGMPPPSSTATTPEAKLEALRRMVPKLAERVRAKTGWDFDVTKVEIALVKKADLAKVLGENIRAQTGVSLEDWARVYGAGATLIPKNLDIAAAYIHTGTKVYLVEEHAGDEDAEEVLYHELIHAAQGQAHPEFWKALAASQAECFRVAERKGPRSEAHKDAMETFRARNAWLEGQTTRLQKDAYPRSKIIGKLPKNYLDGMRAFDRATKARRIDEVFENPHFADAMLKRFGVVTVPLEGAPNPKQRLEDLKRWARGTNPEVAAVQIRPSRSARSEMEASALEGALRALAKTFDVRFEPGERWSIDRKKRIVRYPEGLVGFDRAMDLGGMLVQLANLAYALEPPKSEPTIRDHFVAAVDLLRAFEIVGGRYRGAEPLLRGFVGENSRRTSGDPSTPRAVRFLDQLHARWATGERSTSKDPRDREAARALDEAWPHIAEIIERPSGYDLSTEELPKDVVVASAREAKKEIIQKVWPFFEALLDRDEQDAIDAQKTPPPPDMPLPSMGGAGGPGSSSGSDEGEGEGGGGDAQGTGGESPSSGATDSAKDELEKAIEEAMDRLRGEDATDPKAGADPKDDAGQKDETGGAEQAEGGGEGTEAPDSAEGPEAGEGDAPPDLDEAGESEETDGPEDQPDPEAKTGREERADGKAPKPGPEGEEDEWLPPEKPTAGESRGEKGGGDEKRADGGGEKKMPKGGRPHEVRARGAADNEWGKRELDVYDQIKLLRARLREQAGAIPSDRRERALAKFKNELRRVERILAEYFRPDDAFDVGAGFDEEGEFDLDQAIQVDLRRQLTGVSDPRVYRPPAEPTERTAAVMAAIDLSLSRYDAKEDIIDLVAVLDELLCRLEMLHGYVNFSYTPAPERELRKTATLAERRRLLDTIKIDGGTDDYLAVKMCSEMLDRAPPTDQRTIFVITDGEGNSALIPFLAELEARGVKVLGIGIGPDSEKVADTYPRHLLIPSSKTLVRDFLDMFVKEMRKPLPKPKAKAADG
jgi:hypothetical protein